MKQLLSCVGKYKKQTLLTPFMVVGEVVVDIMIPLLMSRIIDVGIQNRDVGYVARVGGLMVLCALVRCV